MIRFTGNKM